MPPVDKRGRERKQKTKTFTSCWTCRARKVKCDGVRPGCDRCSKACLLCEGYAVKLYWITGEEGAPPSAIKRQAMSLEGYPRWSFSLEMVDRKLAELDHYDSDLAGYESCSSEPFSVFDARFQRQGHAGEESFQRSVFSAHSSGADLDTRIPFDEPNDLFIRDEDGDEGRTQYELIAYDSRPSIQASYVQETWFRRSSLRSFLELNTSIHQNDLASWLMDNYVHRVANLLQPIPHPQNTYTSIYVPKAMLGFARLLGGPSEASSNNQATNEAIFYSLMAASAFHLRGTDGHGRLDGLARDFRAKAFTHLQKAVEELPGPDSLVRGSSQSTVLRYEATMSAMLTLVTTDVIDGDMSEYWVHLEGVNRIRQHLQNLNGGQPLSSHAHRLFTISSFLNILSDSTTVKLPSLPWSDTTDFPDLNNDMFSDGGYGLEFTYGITSTLANLLHQTTILSQHISYFPSRALPIPLSLLTKARDHSTILSSWSIDDEDLSTLTSIPESRPWSHPTLLGLAKLHMLAFATSLRIYFHTRVLPCTSSHEMSHLVQRVAEYLTCIEDIKAVHIADINAKMTASITWPGFIASCEAEPGHAREVWFLWWETMLQYRIGNIAHLWMVVKEAWALRDAGSREVPAWMAVLRRTGKRVLAV